MVTVSIFPKRSCSGRQPWITLGGLISIRSSSNCGKKAGPPARPTVEYIGEDKAGPVLINLLKIAQVEVGAVVPFREDFPKRVTLYSRHAQHLVAGLLERMPADQLSRPMRIARLENQVGL